LQTLSGERVAGENRQSQKCGAEGVIENVGLRWEETAEHLQLTQVSAAT